MINLYTFYTTPLELQSDTGGMQIISTLSKKKKGTPEQLAIIGKSTELSLKYAEDIACGEFPLGEPAIARDVEHSYFYVTNVLHIPLNWSDRHAAVAILKKRIGENDEHFNKVLGVRND